MDPRFRPVYLLLGAIGLAALVYLAITTFPEINPGYVLIITIPDLLFFFLAYKTYPVEDVEPKRYIHSSRRRSF